MSIRFVVVPEWQGSGSARAMQLVDGAEAIRDDLPAASTTVIDVPLEAGDAEGTGIHRFSSLRVVRQRFSQAAESMADPIVTIGGDCSVEHPAVARAAARASVAVVWFDAHPDANSVDSSPSKAFCGMVARALVDEGVIPAARLILAGTRNWDEGEEEWVAAESVVALDVDRLRDPSALVAAVAATGAESVYIHVDLDVLDPGVVEGITSPEPFGMTAAELVDAIKALREKFPLAGGGICEFAPASPAAAVEDMSTILRIIGAISRGV